MLPRAKALESEEGSSGGGRDGDRGAAGPGFPWRTGKRHVARCRVHGLGVAWGEGLHPISASEIVLCTPDTLTQALQQIVT